MEPVCIGGAMISDVKHVPQANDAQQLMRDREHLRLLLQVNNALVSHLDLHELLRAISDALGRLIQHDYSSLCLYDEGAREFRVHALEFATGRGLIREEVVFKAEGSPAGEAFSKRQPLVVDNLGTHQFPNDVTGWLLAEGIKSACWLPLVRGQRCFGALCIGNRRPSTIPREELPLLTEVVNQVAIAVENALAFRQISEFKDRLAKEKDYLEDEIRAEYDYEEMVGRSPEWRRLLEQIETVAPTDATVLILGETGTGKELIARAIHNRSPRRERTMVKVNCASVPTGLLESELFGHEKGAFTGAISQYIGRFELAHKGTILLDEIGDIPLELQPKLLRALQERQFERLGSTRTITVDPRVIASTNHDLRELVRRREFRDDLYYRLNVFPIVVPPLRQRRGHGTAGRLRLAGQCSRTGKCNRARYYFVSQRRPARRRTAAGKQLHRSPRNSRTGICTECSARVPRRDRRPQRRRHQARPETHYPELAHAQAGYLATQSIVAVAKERPFRFR
jgi:formate hydrogenlyase transcriptional activator